MDEQVFEELIRREHAGVYRAAARVFRQAERARAEDVAQSVFLRLIDGRLKLDGVRHPGAVLRHYAARLALEELRRSSARQLREDRYMLERTNSSSDSWQASADLEPDLVLAEQETLVLLATEMERLDDEQRLPMTLRYQEEWTFAQIARELGCSETTAHSRVNRGVELLRARMVRAGGAGVVAATTVSLESALAALPSPVVPTGLPLKLLALRSGVTAGAGIGLASWAALAGALVLAISGLALFFDGFHLGQGGDSSASAGIHAQPSHESEAAESVALAAETGEEERLALATEGPSPAFSSGAQGLAGQDPSGSVGARLRGRFVDRDRAPLTRLPLRLRTPGGKGGASFTLDVRTTSTGEFEITLPEEERARSRRFDLVALPAESTSWTQPVIDLAKGEVRELGEMRLANISSNEVGSWRLDLELIGQDGLPIAGVRALVFDADHRGNDYPWKAQAQGTSGESGACTLEGERLGMKRVVIDGRRRGYCRRTLEITMIPGLVRRETLTLPVGLTIRGQVLDVDGERVRGVVMNSSRIVEGKRLGFESELSGSISMEDGSFLIRGLDPGPLEIEFSGSNWSTARVRAEAGTEDVTVSLKRRADLRDVGDHEGEIHGAFVGLGGEPIETEDWNVDVLRLERSATGRFLTDVLPNAIWPMPRQVEVMAQRLGGMTESEQAAEEERQRLQRLQFHKTGLEPGSWFIVSAVYPRRGFAGPVTLAERELRTGLSVPALENSTVSGVVVGPDGEVPVGRATVLLTGAGPESEARIAEEHKRLIERENDRMNWVRGGARTEESTGSFERDDVPLGIEFRIVALHENYEAVVLDLPESAKDREGLELRFTRRR